MGKKTQNKTRPKRHSKTTEVESNFLSLRIAEAFGLFMLALTAYFLICLTTHNPNDPSLSVAGPAFAVSNKAGLIGAYLSDILLEYFGIASFILPIISGFYALQLLMHKESQDRYIRILTLPILLISTTVIFQMWNVLPHWPIENNIGNGGIINAAIFVCGCLWEKCGLIGDGDSLAKTRHIPIQHRVIDFER